MLKKEEILNLTNNGLSVFNHYLNCDWRLRRNFRNPFYNDTKASCNVYWDKNRGVYKIKDFGLTDFSGDCFFLVGIIHNLNCGNSADFVEIMRIINKDMNLGLNENYKFAMQESKQNFAITPQNIEKRIESKIFSYIEQPFRENECQYWGAYGINQETLNRYGVCSIAKFTGISKNDKEYYVKSSLAEPVFGYGDEKYVKLYRPFSPEYRFLYGGTTPDCYCFGLKQLPSKGDVIFITSGEKDVLSLAAKGYIAICFNSETKMIPDEIIGSLYHRFKHIVVLFDMDKTGVSSSRKMAKDHSSYNVLRMELPLSGEKGEKDISDYFRIGYTKQDFAKLFLKMLDSLYTTTMTMLRSCEIDYANPPIIADKIISVDNVPLATEGNILCITGGEGTGKSNYVASILSGSLSKVNDIDTLGLDVLQNKSKKAVLLYDTEQSEVQLYKNVSNLLRRAKLESKPDEFKAFCLTSLSRKARLNAIIQSMDRYYYEYGGIGMVVIDGVADLVRCANDEAESIAVVDELYRLAGIYKTTIITVLHYVPNGLKLRGHLGSEIQRKAAAIISIEKDKDPAVSVVKTLKVRDGSPLDVPIMQFSWNKSENMHTYIGNKSGEVKDERKRQELERVLSKIFEDADHIKFTALSEKIQEIMSVGESTAKNYINYMKRNGLLAKDMYQSEFYVKGV
ncbi:MAG: bifunctional DNA primase/helicase [Rikenellaceae bacterium]